MDVKLLWGVLIIVVLLALILSKKVSALSALILVPVAGALAEISRDGRFVVTKVTGAGGMVTPATCKEQLLYEVGDPSEYISPDVVADFSGVRFREIGKDLVEVSGGKGREKTGMLKVSVGYRDSFMGEGQISYGGTGARQRAELAIEIVRQRLIDTGVKTSEVKSDLIGIDSLYGKRIPSGDPYEVRVRVAARTGSMKEALRIGNEVETLYTNGPSGGGGVTRSAREVIAIQSVLIPSGLREEDYPLIRDQVTPERVKEHFAGIVKGRVIRYELPGIGALNFVLQEALSGGVTRSLCLDIHGKTLSSALLDLDIHTHSNDQTTGS